MKTRTRYTNRPYQWHEAQSIARHIQYTTDKKWVANGQVGRRYEPVRADDADNWTADTEAAYTLIGYHPCKKCGDWFQSDRYYATLCSAKCRPRKKRGNDESDHKGTVSK